jgi:hypothetical protein
MKIYVLKVSSLFSKVKIHIQSMHITALKVYNNLFKSAVIIVEKDLVYYYRRFYFIRLEKLTMSNLASSNASESGHIHAS